MVTCAGLFYQYFVLKHYRENKLAVVNIAYVLTLIGILMIICGNQSNNLTVMFIASMIITFGSYLGHQTTTNTLLMLMGTEAQKTTYKFKKYRKIERAQQLIAEIIGILVCGLLYVYCAKVIAKRVLDKEDKSMYSAEFECMLITYSLMGGIIFIGIIMSNVFGFGIISTYHLSFEVTLQERVMRFQMQEKFSKWDSNENKTKLFKDWIEQMNFVQEEYRLFTAYAEERKGTGAKGLKVTKISEKGTADNTGVNQSEVDDDSCYY